MEQYIRPLLNAFQTPLQNQILVFAIMLLIVLLAPVLLRKFKIPSIIVLIISGIIIGPHGFDVIEKNPAIDLFSTIGLLYIMFIAGLDLDINEFRATKYRSGIFGVFTFIIPMGLGILVCHELLKFNYETSILTSCMFASHTLITYPIASKLGVTKNQAVAVTVGGTIITDSAVLILLAVIIGQHDGTLDFAFWMKMVVSLAIFTFIMFKVVPLLSKWFFRQLESEKHSHYIYVLSVLFFSGFLAQMCGFEPIIGAFIAGLVLNRLIPSSSALMNRIEFIGNSLFIPFFLISVGMLVDVSALFKGPEVLAVAVVLTTVALFGKWLATFLSQKLFGYSVLQRRLMFGLSSSRAAATLAVVLVGFRTGIVDDVILNGAIILILLTCIIASFITQSAARQLVLQENNFGRKDAMSLSSKDERLMLPISPETQFERLLDFALLIKDKKSIAPISLVTVLPNNKNADAEIVVTRNKLEQYVMQGSASEARVDVDATLDFNVSGGIVRMAREKMADIIIMGWPRQMGILDMLIGENAGNVIINSDKTAFMCQMIKPLVIHKQIVMIAPRYFEKEPGFPIWFAKMSKLAQELSLPISLFCHPDSHRNIQRYIHKIHLNLSVLYREFTVWEDFVSLLNEIDIDDLLIVVSARKGSVSYVNSLEDIPVKLERYFKANNKVVIYPQQFEERYNNLLGSSGLLGFGQ